MDGRGQYHRWDKRTTTGELLAFDVKNLAKDSGLERYKSGLWQWTWTSGSESSIRYEVKPGQGVRLHYKSNSKPFDYLVRVVTTPCHFGGQRYWWLCPQCGRRCRILYSRGLFVCRSCSGAYYETQASKDIAVRIHNELRRLRAKLGAQSLSSDNLPPKPKRMHWRTYSRLAKRILQLQQGEEIANLVILFSYGETIGMGQPGTAADLKEQLRWSLGNK